jgi:hypothetical protein
VLGGEIFGTFGLDALAVPALPQPLAAKFCAAAEQMNALTVKPLIGKTQ